MAAKFSQARKNAFLAAVSETGNQTIAAERAKVSRSWVQLHRSQDAEFRSAVDAAVAEARVRLGAHAARRPPDGWGFADGEELVVKGTGGAGGGKRVQIARARVRQWSPRVEERFLAALAATCNVKAACAEVALTPASAYGHRRRWPAFARRWRAAIEEGFERLETGLIECAGNFLSGEELPDAEPLRGMTVDHAIHLLHMHKHEVRKLGGRPGRRARPLEMEDVRASIERKIEVIARGEPAGIARAREDWAARRPTPCRGDAGVR